MPSRLPVRGTSHKSICAGCISRHIFFSVIFLWLLTESFSGFERHLQECREQNGDSEDGDQVTCFALSSTFFYMLLGETSNEGHQNARNRTKEIKKRKGKYLISSRENCLDSGRWCCRKNHFALNSSLSDSLLERHCAGR